MKHLRISIENTEIHNAIGIYLLTNRVVEDDSKLIYQRFIGFSLTELPIVIGRSALYSEEASFTNPNNIEIKSFQGFYSAYPEDVFDIERLILVVRKPQPLELHLYSEKSKQQFPYFIECGLVISE